MKNVNFNFNCSFRRSYLHNFQNRNIKLNKEIKHLIYFNIYAQHEQILINILYLNFFCKKNRDFYSNIF